MVVFFKDPCRFFHREGSMYERPFCPMLVFQKGTFSPTVNSWFYSALRGVLINFIQIMRTGIVDKFKCYGTYALVDAFIDRQPVNWLKLFTGCMMFLVQLQAKPNALVLCDLYFPFFNFSFRLGYHAEQT